jgi:hypothetical protein
MALFMPLVAVVAEVRAAGGGVLRYLFGLPLALVMGGLTVLLAWHSGRFFWQRSQRYCGGAQKIVVIGMFALQFFWIMLACICGSWLAHLVIKSV